MATTAASVVVEPPAQTPLAVEMAARANREEPLPSSMAGSAGDSCSNDALTSLPYRPNVSVLLVHPRTLHAFVAKRCDDPYGSYQCPQGGIDPGEKALDAALRELWEETGVKNRSVRVIGATGWLAYDFPDWVRAKLSRGMSKYRGQAQRWYCMLYTGEGDGSSEIDLSGGGQHAREFSEWAWRPLDRLAPDVSEFKREVYAEVAREFGALLRELEEAGVVGKGWKGGGGGK
jgi:putative (di)nucleoside polyphosphate hydrolase